MTTFPCGLPQPSRDDDTCDYSAPDYQHLVDHIEVVHPGYLPPPPPEPRSGAEATRQFIDTEVKRSWGEAVAKRDQTVAETDPAATQLCGTCLHQQRWHNVDGCHRRDPDTTILCGCSGFRDGPTDIEDPTRDPDIEELPAVTTSMTPAQFQEWVNSEGDIFVVYLPGSQSFIIKVPELHYQFFVAMMQQVKFCLGNAVQAVRMSVVQGPPPDVDANFAPGDQQGYADFTKPDFVDYPADRPRCTHRHTAADNVTYQCDLPEGHAGDGHSYTPKAPPEVFDANTSECGNGVVYSDDGITRHCTLPFNHDGDHASGDHTWSQETF